MSDENIDLGIYRHRKGCLYEVIAIGRSSNDCHQKIVVYKSLEDSDFPAGTIWVRPLTEFNNPPDRFIKE